MKIIPLSQNEAAMGGFTHKIVLLAADLALLTTATAASIYPGFNGSTNGPAGLMVKSVAWRVVTAFTHAATAVFSVGDGGDAARFIAASTDLKTAAYGNGAITKFPYPYAAADTIDITATVGSGALSTIAAGELHIYLELADLSLLNR